MGFLIIQDELINPPPWMVKHKHPICNCHACCSWRSEHMDIAQYPASPRFGLPTPGWTVWACPGLIEGQTFNVYKSDV